MQKMTDLDDWVASSQKGVRVRKKRWMRFSSMFMLRNFTLLRAYIPALVFAFCEADWKLEIREVS